jgi:UDP-N-acetylglucosamine acyltransferase
MTGVHQFCHIGDFAMSAGCSLVVKDVPAYVMVGGNPASAHGMNYEGMKRRGWSKETINTLRRAYKTVYREGRTLDEALVLLDGQLADCAELAPFVASLKASTRGITR